MYLITLISIVILILMFRYVPGFKCIGYCGLKKRKIGSSSENIRQITKFDNSGRVINVNTDGLSKRHMYKLYINSAPIGCEQFNYPSWLITAREILKDRIADKELLE